MTTLNDYYKRYKAANSNVSFFHWLEGDAQSISELATQLGYANVDKLKTACKCYKN